VQALTSFLLDAKCPSLQNAAASGIYAAKSRKRRRPGAEIAAGQGRGHG
jgi:hypothetical protein